MGPTFLRFTIGRMMIAVAIIALLLLRPELVTLLLLLAGASVAVRSLVRRGHGERSRSWAGPYLVAVACLYLPFAWVILAYPWDDYRWHWIKLWPILPGLVGGMFFHPRDTLMAPVAGTVAILLVILFTAIGRKGQVALILANVIALVGATLESWLAYQLFLW